LETGKSGAVRSKSVKCYVESDRGNVVGNHKEDQAKHLELVQGIVTRMARNSFLLKGWTVTLVAAIFALTAKDSNINYSALAFLPALTLWGWMHIICDRSDSTESCMRRFAAGELRAQVPHGLSL
jgi:hypothetical protein